MLTAIIVAVIVAVYWTLAYREMVGMAPAPVAASAGELEAEAGEEPAPEE